VTPELESLLALQADDDVVDGLRARLAELEPRRRALEVAREAATRRLNQAKGTVEEDERRQRETEGRISDHRQRQDRNLAHLDAVKRMREATAAMLQVESGRKILLEEEGALRSLVSRITEGHAAIRAHEQALVDIDVSQAEARRVLDADSAAIEAELQAARAMRDAAASGVRGPLLMKYERIRGRRADQAVFALVDGSCGCCDTAVPVQRRILMLNTGSIEVCETCGVLLYATE
jgi:predicted  nucleic acid-binding Zn-ribbon protein